MQVSIQAAQALPRLWLKDPVYEAAFVRLRGLEGYDHKHPVCSLTLKDASGKRGKAHEALRESFDEQTDRSTKSERRTLESLLSHVLGDSVEVKVVANERWDTLNGTSTDLTPKPYAIFFGSDGQTQRKPKVFVKASSLTITGELRQEAFSLLVGSIAEDLAQKGFGDRGGILRQPQWKVNLNNLLKKWPSSSPLPPISEVEQFSSDLPSNPTWRISELAVKDLIRLCHVRILNDGAYEQVASKRLSDAATIFYLSEESRTLYPDGPAKDIARACERLRGYELSLPVPDECVYPNRIGMNIRDKFRDDLAQIAEDFNIDPAELLFIHITLLRSELRFFEVYGSKAPYLPSLESIELRELAFLTLVDQKLARKLHHEAFRALKPQEYESTRSAFRDKLGMTQTESEVFLDVFMDSLRTELLEFSKDIKFEVKGNEKRYPSCFRKVYRDSSHDSNLHDSVKKHEDLIRCMIILRDDDRDLLSLAMEHLRDKLPAMSGGRVEKIRLESEHGGLGAFGLKLILEHPKAMEELTLEIQVMTESFYDHKYNRGATHRHTAEVTSGGYQLPGQVGKQTSHVAYKHGKWTESSLSESHGIPRESVPKQEYLVTEPELTEPTRDERVKEYLSKARRFVHCEVVNASHSVQKEKERGEVFKIRAGSNLADLFFAMKPGLNFELTSFKVRIKGSGAILPLDHKLSPFEKYVVYPPEAHLHLKQDVLGALDATTSLLGLLQTCPEQTKKLKASAIRDKAVARLQKFGLQGAELAIAQRLGLCKSNATRVPPELYLAIISTYPDRPNKAHLEGNPGDYILADDYLRALSLTLFSSISAQKFSQQIQLEADEPFGLTDFINVLELAKVKGLSLVSCSSTVEQDGIYYTTLEFSGENLDPKLRDLTNDITQLSRPRSSSIHIGHTSAELVFDMEEKPGELLGLLKHLKDSKNGGKALLEDSYLGFSGVTSSGTKVTLSLGYSSSLLARARMEELELKAKLVAREILKYLSKDASDSNLILRLTEMGGKEIEMSHSVAKIET